MSRRERARLMRALAALEHPRMAGPGRKRRRRLFLAGIIVCCVGLAVQIGVLALTLPRYYRSGDWRGAWVGFDVALFCTFAVTASAAWRARAWRRAVRGPGTRSRRGAGGVGRYALGGQGVGVVGVVGGGGGGLDLPWGQRLMVAGQRGGRRAAPGGVPGGGTRRPRGQ